MFDNVTRLFSLKGDDRITIGASLSNNEETETALDAENSKLEEKDIDSVEIDGHALIDDLISADDDLATEFDIDPTETSFEEPEGTLGVPQSEEHDKDTTQETDDNTEEVNKHDTAVID